MHDEYNIRAHAGVLD